jgi:hypothetical protein
MYISKRRPRHWLLSSKILILAVGVAVLGISASDGIEYEEIGSLLVVLAVALYVAHREDKHHAHIDDLEERLTKLTRSTGP